MVELAHLKVALFLKSFKQLAQSKGIYVVNREKNNQALIELGLTKENRKEEIFSLSVEDYCDGPQPDSDKPGELWFFGKKIINRDIYIKLKIAEVGAAKIAKCISFHFAERPLRYPFKK